MIVKNDGAERMIKSPMVMAKAVAELEADAAVDLSRTRCRSITP
jgi:hypothetical protein